MNKTKNYSQLEMKIENRKRVLEQIKGEKESSRASLAKELQMSPTSMTRICNDLIGLGLIREFQSDASRVGRKALVLEKNPEAFYSMGILIRLDFLSFIVIDYMGNILFHRKWEETVEKDENQVLSMIQKHFREMELEEADIFQKIKAVGVSFPGTIDETGKQILYSDLFQWKDTAFGEMLEKELGIFVSLETDVKASILEEYLCHEDFQKESIGFLSLSQEAGAAFMKNGELLRGHMGRCGEISHKTLIYHGRKCKCQKQGCVAAYLSEAAIIEQASEMGCNVSRLEEIQETQLLKKLAEYLVLVLEDMMIWHDPELIILGGRTIRIFPEILEYVKEEIQQRNESWGQDVIICSSRNAGNESMLGAAYAAMENYEQEIIHQ